MAKKPIEVSFSSDECMAILDVVDRVFNIPQVLFRGIFDPNSGLSVNYSLKLESYCKDEVEKKAIKKLREGGRFHVPGEVIKK